MPIPRGPAGFSVAAYDRAIRAAGPLRLRPRLRPLRRDVAEWRTGPVFREGYLYPDVPRQGSSPLGGAADDPRPSTTPPSRCCGSTPHSGKAVVVDVSARSATRAGVALVGRIGSEQHGRRRLAPRLQAQRRADLGAAARPGPLRPDHRGADQRRHQRRSASAPADFDWNYLTDTAPFRARARLVR